MVREPEQQTEMKKAEEDRLINAKVNHIVQTTKLSWSQKEAHNINISFQVFKMPSIVKLSNCKLTAREASRLDEFVKLNGARSEAVTKQNKELIVKAKQEEEELKSRKQKPECQLSSESHQRDLPDGIREHYRLAWIPSGLKLKGFNNYIGHRGLSISYGLRKREGKIVGISLRHI
jgi:hypothetical protein